jgi:hypothetical protein
LLDGRERVVRHGHDPEHPILPRIGLVEVEILKARDRGAVIAEERIRYSWSILPKWARRTKSLDGRAFCGQKKQRVTWLPRLNFRAETNACQQQ